MEINILKQTEKDLCTILLVVAIITATYWYMKKEMSYFKELGLPHITPWPLFGNMMDAFFQRKHIIDVLDDVYNLNPDAKYVGFYDFRTPIIVLRDPEIVKNVTVKYFDHFPDHRGFINEKADPFFGKNLFSLQGEKWRKMRYLLSPAFTASKLKTMFRLMCESSENFVDFVGKGSMDHEMKNIFTRFTHDVIVSTAFGINVDSMKFPNNEIYILAKKTLNLEGILSIKFFIAKKFPFLMKCLRAKIISSETAMFFQNIVHSTVTMRDSKGISRPDMLQLMMDAREKPEGHMLGIEEMTAQALSFFLGGFDTVATSMSALAQELAFNKQIQHRLQNEIDEVLQKTGGNLTYEAINSMPYMDAVLYENNRRYTQAIFVDRMCVKSFELPPSLPGMKPLTIKPGMNIWIPAASFHRDSKYYDEPSKFDPDRFLHKKVTTNQTTYLSFGCGPRMCIASRFALLETKILFFHLLSKCNLRTCEKTVPFRLNPKSFTLGAKDGFWVTIEPRNNIKQNSTINLINEPCKAELLNNYQNLNPGQNCACHGDHRVCYRERKTCNNNHQLQCYHHKHQCCHRHHCHHHNR